MLYRPRPRLEPPADTGKHFRSPSRQGESNISSAGFAMAGGTLTSGVIIPRVHRLVCGKKLRARAFLHQEAEIEQVTSAEAIKSVYREPRTEQRMYNSAERVLHSCVSTKPSDLLSRLLETSSDVVRLEAINRKLDYEFGEFGKER